MSENAKQPDLPKGLIGRRVASSSSASSAKATRLPSLRGPRDLTLGGVPKKVFTPTIPARRDKAKDESATGKSSKSQFPAPKVKYQERGRGRGRGRGSRDNNLVQSHSIFEQGPAQKQWSQKGSSYREERDGSSSSKISVKKEKSYVKKDLSMLLRDDFIDDGENDNTEMAPVILPLTSKIKKEVKAEIKTEIKPEDDKEDDTKSKSSEDVEMVDDSKILKSPKKTSTGNIDGISCQNIFNQCNKTEVGDLLFLQLPDTLPGLPPSRDEPEKVPKSESTKKPEEKSDSENLSNLLSTCCLSDFSEGHIGKLQIHKSGRCELLLGNVKLDVTLGTPNGFLQEIVSVNTTQDGGYMSVLGHVKHRVICTPNFESLLNNT